MRQYKKVKVKNTNFEVNKSEKSILKNSALKLANFNMKNLERKINQFLGKRKK